MPGHHNGFNPFRDAHGKWTTPGAAATKNDAPMPYLERGAHSQYGHARAGATAAITPADAKFITNQARAQHELGGKHAGKSIEQVYREDPGHLHAQAYNGTIYGTHIGNEMRLKDDSLFDPAAQLNQHIRTKAGR